MQDPVLIIGASGTIGSAIARKLAAEGTALLLHGRGADGRLDALSQELGAPAIAADLTDDAGIATLAEAAAAQGSGLSGLVFSAAQPFPHKLTLRTDWSVFQDQIDSQVKAFHQVMTRLKPMLADRPDGARVVVLSTEYVIGAPPPKIAPYVAAKAALTRYAQVLAQEVLAAGIRIQILAPGMVRSALTADMPDEYLDIVADGMPEKRLTAAQDVADLCGFLLTPAADTLYGSIIPVTRAQRR